MAEIEDYNEERSSRPALIATAVVVLCAAASGAILLRGTATDTLGAAQKTGTPRLMMAQGPGGPPPGVPMPGGPGAPAGGGTTPQPAAAPGAKPVKTSFDDVPPTLGGPVKATELLLPPPIKQGKFPDPVRNDPFISRYVVKVDRPYAFNFTIPIRLAPPLVPEAVEAPPLPPELQPPLPYIPRRVAGVVYNGAISALLETGNPGSGSVDIVQPGSQVQSGIPGVGMLTVETISREELILRSTDGRSVTVKLSNLPPGVADSLRGQTGGAGGGASFSGGGPGGPGGRIGGGGGPGGAGAAAD